MLILTRDVDESIILGADIVISVIEIRGRSVRLGVTAPASVRVLRDELYESATGAPPPKTSMGDAERTGASRRRRRPKPGGPL